MMAYEYGYTGAYSPYTPTPATPAYPSAGIPQRPYTGIYGANSGMMQNTPVQQISQPQQSNVPWIQVPNIEAARNVMVQPNQTAYMMNQNAPEFYVKSTDQMGVATLRSFRFQEFDPAQEAAREVLNSQSDKLVSREEFNNFASSVAAQFNALQQSISIPLPQQNQQVIQQSPPQPIIAEQKEVQSAKPVTPAKKKESVT